MIEELPQAVEGAARAAAEALDTATALLVTAGAGMGVDSGLPDFRGDQGFWRAYPAFRALGLSFVELANPRWFREDPGMAWGFYGHRFNLYRATRPHDGFARLLRWGADMAHGTFVFTSNVDGHFQRAGFADERVVECHGTLGIWQCMRRCAGGPFVAPDQDVAVDATTCRAPDPLPACPACAALCRPNVLLFGDGDWDGRRSVGRQRQLGHWLDTLGPAAARLVIVECGAGNTVPTVRAFGEAVASELSATLIRINVREPEVPAGAISIAAPARAALAAIDGYRARR